MAGRLGEGLDLDAKQAASFQIRAQSPERCMRLWNSIGILVCRVVTLEPDRNSGRSSIRKNSALGSLQAGPEGLQQMYCTISPRFKVAR